MIPPDLLQAVLVAAALLASGFLAGLLSLRSTYRMKLIGLERQACEATLECSRLREKVSLQEELKKATETLEALDRNVGELIGLMTTPTPVARSWRGSLGNDRGTSRTGTEPFSEEHI